MYMWGDLFSPIKATFVTEVILPIKLTYKTQVSAKQPYKFFKMSQSLKTSHSPVDRPDRRLSCVLVSRWIEEGAQQVWWTSVAQKVLNSGCKKQLFSKFHYQYLWESWKWLCLHPEKFTKLGEHFPLFTYSLKVLDSGCKHSHFRLSHRYW